MVAAFNAVAAVFGRQWVDASRIRGGAVSGGTSPTLYIVTLARLLGALDDVPNATLLIDKVREGHPDARAELIAIYLLRAGNPEVLVEVEPEVRVGERDRKPDFRTRVSHESWTYVEVTNPNSSQAQEDVSRGLEKLTRLVNDCSGSFALEVFLKREPTANELDLIAAEVEQGHQAAGQSEVELPSGLGTLFWNHQPPGTVVTITVIRTCRD